MSLRLTLSCDGHRHGTPCRSSRTTGYGYSPTLRSDDPARALITPALLEHWRIGVTHTGGDLCPHPDHDEDRRRTADLDHARQVLEQRRNNDGLT